jgi:phage shock protein A
MNEVKRYHVQLYKLAEDQQKYAHGALGAVEIVRASDFDRVTAERDAAKETLERWHELNLQREAKLDALQQRLTAADQEIDDLRAELKAVRLGPCKMIVGDELP